MGKTLDKKSLFRVKNLSRKQAELLKQGRLPLSMFVGFLGGTGSQMVFSKNEKPEEEDSGSFSETDTSEEEENLYEFEAPSEFNFSEEVNDDMSFGEAFKAARADTGAGGFFNWKGNSYHTLTKEEWDALPEEERAAISQKIQENTHFESSEYHKSEEDDYSETEKEQIDDKEVIEEEDDHENDQEEITEESLTDEEAELIDEITFGDLIFEEDEEFVEIDEFGETEDIIAGLNDGIAETEEDGISGGVSTDDLFSDQDDPEI